MRKANLMTMSMFMRIFFKYQIDHDLDDLRDGYEEMLDLVQAAGYQGVDVTSWETETLGLDYVKTALKNRGINVSSFIYPDYFAKMDAEGFWTRVENAKRGADKAAELETEIFMLVPQAQKEIEEYEPGQIRGRMVEHWKPVTEYARKLGLHVVVEDTPDLKLHFCRSNEVMEVLEAVDGLELVYDSANMTLVGEDPIEYLRKFRDKIAYVHLKDYRKAPSGSMMVEYTEDGTAMASAPTGTGVIDLKRIIKMLKESEYQGGMTVEFRVDDNNEYLRSLIRSREYVEE